MMGETQIESAKARDDKKFVSNEYTECPRCGHDEEIITYYDNLANDRTCVSCHHTH